MLALGNTEFQFSERYRCNADFTDLLSGEVLYHLRRLSLDFGDSDIGIEHGLHSNSASRFCCLG